MRGNNQQNLRVIRGKPKNNLRVISVLRVFRGKLGGGTVGSQRSLEAVIPFICLKPVWA